MAFVVSLRAKTFDFIGFFLVRRNFAHLGILCLDFIFEVLSSLISEKLSIDKLCNGFCVSFASKNMLCLHFLASAGCATVDQKVSTAEEIGEVSGR